MHLQVLNGSGVTGVAGTTASALTAKGFTVTGTGPAANYNFTSSVIQYSSAAQLPEVNTLRAEIGSVVVQQDTALGAGSLNLIVGSSFKGLATAKGPGPKSSAKALSNLAKSYGGITASTNICQDSAAFAGPDIAAARGLNQASGGLNGAGAGQAGLGWARPPCGGGPPGASSSERPAGWARRAPSWDTTSQAHRPSGYMK